MKKTLYISLALGIVFSSQLYARSADISEIQIKNGISSNSVAMRCFTNEVHQGDAQDIKRNKGSFDSISNNIIGEGHNQLLKLNHDKSANAYNISWARCYLYVNDEISCTDTEGNQNKESLSALTTNYNDNNPEGDHGALIGMLEIGMTNNYNTLNGGVFYNLHPIFNKKYKLNGLGYNAESYSEREKNDGVVKERGYHFSGNLCHAINPDKYPENLNQDDSIYLVADKFNIKTIYANGILELTNQ